MAKKSVRSYMLSSHRCARLCWALFVCVVATAGMIAADSFVDGDHRAKEWTSAHAAALPSSLEELAAYPEVYRRAIIQALSPAEKSRLWQMQLSNVLRTEALTREQRDFVREAMEIVRPSNFASGANPPDLCERIAKLFPNTRVQRMFRATALGTGVPPEYSLQPVLLSLSEHVHSLMSLNAQPWTCTCRNDGWCECGFGYDCINPDGCTECEGCCGCFFGSTCNRLCTERR